MSDPDSFAYVYPVNDRHGQRVAAALLAKADHPDMVKVVTDGPRPGFRVPAGLLEGLDLSPEALAGGTAAPKKKRASRRATAKKQADDSPAKDE